MPSQALVQPADGSEPRDRPADGRETRAGLAWTPRTELDRAAWGAAGQRLGAVTRCSKWWIGDWLNYGNRRWGEKYLDAARITGYDIQSLKNMAHVARQFEPYLRRYDLTWSHHAILVPLEAHQRTRWLDRASAERLSVADLRLELQTAERAGAREQAADDGAAALTEESEAICPRCNHKFPLPTLALP